MAFVLRRLMGFVAVLVLTWSTVFVALQTIPGDPVNLMLDGAPASEAVRENLRHQLGLDRSVLYQYFHFLGRAFDGDLGNSYRARQPVMALIAEQLPATLQLAGGGLVVGLALGMVMGLIAGIRANTWADTFCMTIALIGVSLPSFWIGMVLIYVFGSMLAWVPITGRGLDALILPSITVACTSQAASRG